MSTSTNEMTRSFRFVPFGSKLEDQFFISSSSAAASSATAPAVVIACDGRVSGCTLELSHWNGNTTPESWYADTSTEIALNLPKDTYTDAVVVNNHYDTDGVLSVFACLQSDLAAKYKDLLIAGAAAGDFGEWSSDLGIKLDQTMISFLKNNDEKKAYEDALQQLPDVLKDFSMQEGNKYKHIWDDGWNEALKSYQTFQDGRSLLTHGPGNITILREPWYLSPFAVHRGLLDAKLWETTSRLLRIQETSRTAIYEKPGHGWVSRLRQRRPIPDADGKAIVQALGGDWKVGGPSGLVAICQGSLISDDLHQSTEELAEQLVALDRGATFI
jgi:hypothetical protein